MRAMSTVTKAEKYWTSALERMSAYSVATWSCRWRSSIRSGLSFSSCERQEPYREWKKSVAASRTWTGEGEGGRCGGRGTRGDRSGGQGEGEVVGGCDEGADCGGGGVHVRGVCSRHARLWVELEEGAEGCRLDESRAQLGAVKGGQRAEPTVERDVVRRGDLAELRGRAENLGRHLEELARGQLVSARRVGSGAAARRRRAVGVQRARALFRFEARKARGDLELGGEGGVGARIRRRLGLGDVVGDVIKVACTVGGARWAAG